MKKAKIVKTNKKEEKVMEKNPYSIKNLLSIILVLVIIFGIFYLITTLVLDPVEEKNTSNTITEIDKTKITLSNLLNRKENEYYVLAAKENENDQANYETLYNNYISEYTSLDSSFPFYYVDLSDALNKNYLSDEENISNETNNLKLSNDTLFKIKAGKIEEYFVGSKQILKELSSLKEG